jgi:PKD repeat protein
VTYSNTFPVQDPFEPFDMPNFGTSQFGDAFITKFQPDGQLNWSSYLGGTNNDGGNSIALDSFNNIYITGYTSSSDFPVVDWIPGFGVKHPFQDAFITEVNYNLTSLNMSTFLGGNLDDTGTGIAVSDSQNIFISGFTTSYDFPTSTNYAGVNSFKVTNKFNGNQYGGWVDGFVVHINNVPTPASPVANFTYSIPSPWGCLPIPVTFTDTSTGGPTSWKWDFGDSTANSTAQNPVHWYTNGGNFTVKLTVSNTLGTSSTSQVISVPSSAAPKFTDANSTTAISTIHVAQNGTRKVSLYLAATPRGLSGYNLTLSFRNTTPPTPWVPNTTVANITNVTRPEWIPQNVDIFQVSNLVLDGYNVTFQGADINLAILPGALNVRLANITIHGNQIGNSTLHINSTNMMTDDYGVNITLCPSDANLTVYVERLQPLPASILPPPCPAIPTDPNGDGLYEDVNGDHVYNYYDVIDFFTYLWWITDNYGPITDDTNEYQPFFDFDHNGVVNYMDVITLYYNIPLLI